jgi:hypothetical protein
MTGGIGLNSPSPVRTFPPLTQRRGARAWRRSPSRWKAPRNASRALAERKGWPDRIPGLPDRGSMLPRSEAEAVFGETEAAGLNIGQRRAGRVGV